MQHQKAMKRQNQNLQLQSENSSPSKRRLEPRPGQSADARPSLPRDFDDWLQSEREHLVEKVLLSWHHPNSQAYDRSEPSFSTK